MQKKGSHIILIGGSAGSIPLFIGLLKALPEGFQVPVVLIIHRMRNITSELDQLLAKEGHIKKIIEPEDKSPITKGRVYLAPQNYHLLIEEDKTFSLDYSDAVHYSRPAIDVSFESAARVYKAGTVGILLSGANSDGAAGLGYIAAAGGTVMVQAPATTQYPVMPQAAIDMGIPVKICTPDQLLDYIKQL